MLFHSFVYLFAFLPITWTLYLFLRHTSFRPVLLTVAGYVFYAWGEPWIAILLFVSSTADFLIGLKLDRTKDGIARKTLLILSVFFNLGLLGTFKYSGWVCTNINGLLGFFDISDRVPVYDLPLPPGISFYTFQSMAYIIDIYRHKLRAHTRIWDYWSFVAFFPQLFAGPIERAGHLLPQLTHPRKHIHPRAFEMGLFMIAWGLFKKLVFADNLGTLVQLARDNMALEGAGLVLALAFTFQIYADFSAYSDIARGSARLFGISLRRNFRTPYFSRNPSEFWQRWHISLSSWIRDYLYISLGGDRHGRIRTLLNLVVTMFLAGLWHGAGWFYIVWGLYHGLLLVAYRVYPIDAKLERAWGRIGRVLATVLMFALTVLGWVFFYAGGSTSLQAIFFPASIGIPSVTLFQLAYGLLLFAVPIALTDYLGYRKNREFIDLWNHLSIPAKMLIYLVIFYGILVFGSRDSNEFIYFRF